MQEELKKFSAAVLAGINSQNNDAGTGDAVVNNFARSAFNDINTRTATGVAPMASNVAAEQERQAEAARQARIRELEERQKKLQEESDPGNYRLERKEDGGFDFYDAAGNRIDVNQFARDTGTTPAAILSKSDNPFDQQYVNDYSNTKDLITAIQNGDQRRIQAYTANNEGIGSKRPEDLMRELIKKYPHIYNKGSIRDSYRSNGNPLIRMPTSGGGAAMGGAPAGGGNNYGFTY